MKLDLVDNSATRKINRRRSNCALHKHEIFSASHHWKIRRLHIICDTNNRKGPLVVLQTKSYLCNWNAPKPVKTRCHCSSFCNPNKFGGSIGCNSQRVLKGKQGAKRGCGLTHSCSSFYATHYDISGFVYCLMLEQWEVKGFEVVMGACRCGFQLDCGQK